MAWMKEPSTLCKGTDELGKWGGVVVSPDGRATSQREQRARRNPGMADKGNGKLLPLRQDRLGASWLGSSSAEKALGFLLDPKLSSSQQRVLTAKGSWAGPASGASSATRGGELPFPPALLGHPSAPAWARVPRQGRPGLPGECPPKSCRGEERTGAPDAR